MGELNSKADRVALMPPRASFDAIILWIVVHNRLFFENFWLGGCSRARWRKSHRDTYCEGGRD